MKAAKDFPKLSKNQLVGFISSEKLLVASEGAVYKAVLRWVGADPKNRGSELPMLLQHVHFPLMSRDEVYNYPA